MKFYWHLQRLGKKQVARGGILKGIVAVAFMFTIGLALADSISKNQQNAIVKSQTDADASQMEDERQAGDELIRLGDIFQRVELRGKNMLDNPLMPEHDIIEFLTFSGMTLDELVFNNFGGYRSFVQTNENLLILASTAIPPNSCAKMIEIFSLFGGPVTVIGENLPIAGASIAINSNAPIAFGSPDFHTASKQCNSDKNTIAYIRNWKLDREVVDIPLKTSQEIESITSGYQKTLYLFQDEKYPPAGTDLTQTMIRLQVFYKGHSTNMFGGRWLVTSTGKGFTFTTTELPSMACIRVATVSFSGFDLFKINSNPPVRRLDFSLKDVVEQCKLEKNTVAITFSADL
jgi:hypothetical protein